MWEFLQAYGYWIVAGLFLVFMLRMHAGGGCGSGHGGHGGDGQRGETGPTDVDANDRRDVAAAAPTGRRSGHH